MSLRTEIKALYKTTVAQKISHAATLDHGEFFFILLFFTYPTFLGVRRSFPNSSSPRRQRNQGFCAPFQAARSLQIKIGELSGPNVVGALFSLRVKMLQLSLLNQVSVCRGAPDGLTLPVQLLLPSSRDD